MNLTNLDSAEEIIEVFIVHPEESIILSLHVQFFLLISRPSVRLVAPPTFPFKFTPWVPHLNQLNIFSFLVFYLSGFDN